MSSESSVAERREGPIAWLALNRPEARNALNLAMCRALREKFEALDAHADVRVIMLRAEGPSFCAGADLKERRGRDESWVLARRHAAYAAYEAIGRCRKPVVALVHGAVVGSGGEIAMSCDFIVAEEGTTFRFPEPQWGTVGATQRLQRVIGLSRAKDLLLTGRAMEVREAHECGLVARVAPRGELQSAADEIAAAIAKAPPLAMALTKEAMNLGSQVSLAAGLQIEQGAVERCLRESDWREGVEQFAQVVGNAKRP
jgi:enoyl-CoA hydratase/carnithine racemase